MSNKLFYSTNALLAKIITERFFDNIFQVWSAPKFDSEFNPPSSNPKDIFLRLHYDVKKNDRHSSKINEIRLGLLTAVLNKKRVGLITESQEKDANDIIIGAEVNHFKPLLYLISNVSTLDKESARIEDKAEILSEEYIIKDLKNQDFDIIGL